MSAQPVRHPAFLSYSRKDAEFTHRLHRDLEGYLIPRQVHCAVPVQDRRLYPIYLDQYESPASADLGSQIKDSLEQSSALVIVCSPAGAQSRWVNEEIRYFRSLGRGDRIFCVLAEGEPSDSFPPALLEISAAGAVPGFDATQPAAADLRHPELRGRARRARLREERLRLIAGLIGAQPEDLRRRDREQTLRRKALATALALVVIALSLSAIFWQRARYQGSLQTARVQDYFDKGQRHLLAGEPLKALPYLGAAYEEDPKNRDLRFLLARAMAPLDARQLVIPPGSSRVVAAEFSPDGRSLLTAYKDGPVLLRNAETGKVEQNLASAPPGDREVVAFTPDSRNVATASGPAAEIWDTASGRLRATLAGHELDIKTLEFSPDGKLAVTASVDNTARIWEALSGRPVNVLRGHTASVLWAGFNPDGRTVLTVGNDRTARIWNSISGRLLVRIDAEQRLGSARFSPNGQRILLIGAIPSSQAYVGLYSTQGQRLATWQRRSEAEAGFSPSGNEARIADVEGDAKSLKIWSLPPGELLYSLKGHTEMIGVLRFSNDRERLVSGGFDPTPRIWNLSTGDLEGTFNIPPGKNPLERAVSGAEFAPGDQRLLLSTGDGELSLWDTTFGRKARKVHERGAFYVSYSPDGKYLFSADRKTLAIWSADAVLLTRIEPPGGILHIFTDRSGRRILTASPNSSAQIWNVPDGRLLAVLKGHTQEVTGADFSTDGGSVVTAGADGMAIVWDARTGRPIRSLPKYAARLSAVQLSVDGNHLLLAAQDGSAVVWDGAGAGRVCTLISPKGDLSAAPSARYSPDGNFIVTGGERAKIWKATCALVAEIPRRSQDATVGAFNSDGSRFITTGGFGEPVRIWNTADAALLATLQTSPLLPGSTHFSPDGSWVLVTGPDKANLWNANTGRLLFSFGGATPVAAAAFNPHGNAVATISDDGTLAVWDFRLEALEPREINRRIEAMTPWRLKNGALYETNRARP